MLMSTQQYRAELSAHGTVGLISYPRAAVGVAAWRAIAEGSLKIF